MSIISQTEAVLRAIDKIVPEAKPGYHPSLNHLASMARDWRNYVHESDDEEARIARTTETAIPSSLTFVFRRRDDYERAVAEWKDEKGFWRGLDPAGSGHDTFQVQLDGSGWLTCFYVPAGA